MAILDSKGLKNSRWYSNFVFLSNRIISMREPFGFFSNQWETFCPIIFIIPVKAVKSHPIIHTKSRFSLTFLSRKIPSLHLRKFNSSSSENIISSPFKRKSSIPNFPWKISFLKDYLATIYNTHKKQMQTFKYLRHTCLQIGTDKHQQIAVFTGSLNSRKQQIVV